MEHSSTAAQSIDNFCVDKRKYLRITEQNPAFIIRGDTNANEIYAKDKAYKATFNINVQKVRNCKIFIGSNVAGGITINVQGDNSIIYIGDHCILKQLKIRSKQVNDFIAIGNHVTTTGQNDWVSGKGSGNANPAIIIGDDCMFSYNIVIRNSDAHPIYEIESEKQINEPKGIVHIEPHVWVGEQVNILKSVTVGACSIVGLGSIVTKDIPKFSLARGVPATYTTNNSIYWSRNQSREARKKAKYYVKKYS